MAGLERDRVTSVYVETIAYEPGLWCNRCMLPAAFMLYIAMTYKGRVTLHHRLWCSECDRGDAVTRD